MRKWKLSEPGLHLASRTLAAWCVLALFLSPGQGTAVDIPTGKPPVLLVLPSPHAKSIFPGSTISATIDTRAGLPLENLNLKVVCQGQPVPGRLKRDALHSVLTFTPFKELKPHAPFQVQIEHLRQEDGRYRIVPVFSWSFATAGAPEPQTVPAATPPIVELPPVVETPLRTKDIDHSAITRRLAQLLETRQKQDKEPEKPFSEPVPVDQPVRPEPPAESVDHTQITRRLAELIHARQEREKGQEKFELTGPQPLKQQPGPAVEPKEPPEEDTVTEDIRQLAKIIRQRGRPSTAGPIDKRTPCWDPGVVVERDVLDIRVWNHPELSEKYNVSPTGYLAFPLVGEIKVKGKTVEQIKQLISQRLAEDYIKSPFLTIYHRRGKKVRVNILGRVKRPGIFTFKEPPSLLEAIAAAGGISSKEKQEVAMVQLVRGCVKEDIDLHQILVEGRFENNLFLEDRDILIFKQEFIRERIYVFGSLLKEQGIFRYEKDMTVMDAILMAGGGTTPAELYEQFRPGLRYTQVVRGNLDKPEIIRVNMERMLFRGDLKQNIRLQPGDIVIVPTRRAMDIWAFVKRLKPLLDMIISGDRVVKIFEGQTVY